MRILDEPKPIAERIFHRRDLNALADLGHGLDLLRAEREQPRERRVDVLHAPQRLRSRGAGLPVREKTQLEADDPLVPRLRAGQVGDGINGGS